MPTYNQNPEQVARDKIHAQLRAAGWIVQDKASVDLHAGQGQAVREYPTDTGPTNYILFVGSVPVGVIEAKKESLGHKLTVAEDQTRGYAQAKLKWVTRNDRPPFLYEATGIKVLRFENRIVSGGRAK
jgi:type I restriction enzyme, R subunit